MIKRFKFRPTMTLTQAIWETVNRGEFTPEQLQDEIDYSASALKRAGLDGESGAGFNLRKLVPLMKAQGDYMILEHLAHRCGFLLVSIPKGARSKKDRMRSIAEYQRLAGTVVVTLFKVVDNASDPKEAEGILYKMLKGTAEMMEDVKAGKQIELEFERKK